MNKSSGKELSVLVDDDIPSLEYLLQRRQSLKEYGREAMNCVKLIQQFQNYLRQSSSTEQQMFRQLVDCCTARPDNAPLTAIGKVFSQAGQRYMSLRESEQQSWNEIREQLVLISRLFVRVDHLDRDAKRANSKRKQLESKYRRVQNGNSICDNLVGWLGRRLLSPNDTNAKSSSLTQHDSLRLSLRDKTVDPNELQSHSRIRLNANEQLQVNCQTSQFPSTSEITMISRQTSPPAPPPTSPALSHTSSLATNCSTTDTDLGKRLQEALDLDRVLRKRIQSRCLNEEYATLIRLRKVAQVIGRTCLQNAVNINELGQWLPKIVHHVIPEQVHQLGDEPLEAYFRPSGVQWTGANDLKNKVSVEVMSKERNVLSPTYIQRPEVDLNARSRELNLLNDLLDTGSYSSRVSNRAATDTLETINAADGISISSAWPATETLQRIDNHAPPSFKSTINCKGVQVRTVQTQTKHSARKNSPEPLPESLDKRQSNETMNMSLNSVYGSRCNSKLSNKESKNKYDLYQIPEATAPSMPTQSFNSLSCRKNIYPQALPLKLNQSQMSTPPASSVYQVSTPNGCACCAHGGYRDKNVHMTASAIPTASSTLIQQVTSPSPPIQSLLSELSMRGYCGVVEHPIESIQSISPNPPTPPPPAYDENFQRHIDLNAKHFANQITQTPTQFSLHSPTGTNMDRLNSFNCAYSNDTLRCSHTDVSTQTHDYRDISNIHHPNSQYDPPSHSSNNVRTPINYWHLAPSSVPHIKNSNYGISNSMMLYQSNQRNQANLPTNGNPLTLEQRLSS